MLYNLIDWYLLIFSKYSSFKPLTVLTMKLQNKKILEVMLHFVSYYSLQEVTIKFHINLLEVQSKSNHSTKTKSPIKSCYVNLSPN